MESRKTRELTEDEMKIFITLEIVSNVDELFEKLISTDGSWVLKVIEKRFKCLKIEVDKKIMIAVLAIGDGVVGKCVKYVDDLVSWCEKFHQTKIEWEVFTNKIYPYHIPVF